MGSTGNGGGGLTPRFWPEEQEGGAICSAGDPGFRVRREASLGGLVHGKALAIAWGRSPQLAPKRPEEVFKPRGPHGSVCVCGLSRAVHNAYVGVACSSRRRPWPLNPQFPVIVTGNVSQTCFV